MDIKSALEEASRRHSQGDAATALALYRDILSIEPRQPDALLMLGVIARQAGNAALALNLIEAALAARQNFPVAWFNRGLILHGAGRRDEALQSARLAVQDDPCLAAGWDLLGLLLKETGAYAEAMECCERALSLQPDNAHFHGNCALVLFAQGDWRRALQMALHAEKLDADWPQMILGNLFKAAGYPQLAAARFAHMRSLRPAFADAAASEAMAWLQSGDLEQGWKLWEQRPDLAADLKHMPFWRGQKIARLLAYEDQGLGDALHFLRYLDWVKQRADHIILRIEAPLRRLVAENFSDIEIIDAGAMPAAEARCRLSSLPALAAARLGAIPSAAYLSAAPERCALWREALATMAGPRIGLVWAGNRHFRNDAGRSIAPDLLKPLLACGAAPFISLQKDQVLAGIADAAPLLDDFADTAALIAELDLVVTVDTAVAHLAGAMGKPVFILLPFDADWRWMLGREDSPWYPSARLFRQTRPGGWAGVIENVAREIEKFLAGDRGVLQAAVWPGKPLTQNPQALALDML